MTADGVLAEPAFVHVPPRAGSMVEQVANLSDAIGTPLDPEQRLAVDVATSLRADGRPATLESALITCRQNLKTFSAERIVLTHLVEPDRPRVQPVRLAVWSAHEFRTSQESFRHFDEVIAGFSFLSRRVVRVSRGNGEEEFEFRGGRRLMFRARIRTGGRGLTGDVIVLDEAFALQPAHMGSLLPTLSTRRRAKVIYCSSAGLATSAILRGVRDRGRAGGKGAPAYVEWCAPGSMLDPGCEWDRCEHAPGTPGCALDREDFWRRANPAIGRRIDVEFVQAERLALPPEEFARERLGWWDEPGEVDRRIRIDDWAATARDARPAGPARFFITIGADGSAWIAVAADERIAVDPDGTTGVPHVELADHRPGTAWLGDRLKALADAWPGARFAGGKAGPVGGLVEAGLPVDVELFTSAEMAQACGHHEQLSRTRAYTHAPDPHLDASLASALSKPAGDGLWVWNWRKSPNLAPIAAVTGALWLLEKHRGDKSEPAAAPVQADAPSDLYRPTGRLSL